MGFPSFNNYSKNRDQEMFFESAGFDGNDIDEVAAAMRMWVTATQNLVESLSKIPMVQSDLFHGQDNGDEMQQEVAMEVQRARHIVQEGNLVDMASRMNQFAARLSHGSGQLSG